MHKMERILARTVPVMGAVSGLGSSRKCHGHEQDCHQIAIFRGAELAGEGFIRLPYMIVFGGIKEGFNHSMALVR